MFLVKYFFLIIILDYLFPSGLDYIGFMKNSSCDEMWNINGSFLCHFAYFHDHNSEIFATQLPRQSVRSRKLKNRKSKYTVSIVKCHNYLIFFVV